MKKLICFLLPAFAMSASGQNPFLLKDVFPGNNSGTIQNIVKTTNYSFFNEDDDDPDTDQSLFRTDGTTAGTIKLNLTYPGYISTKAEKLTALGNKVVFAGDNFAPGYGEIWASDGTQAGTIALERFTPTSPTGGGPVYELVAMNGYVYYTVVANNNKLQLRRTDGTPGGTSLVYEFNGYTGTAPEGALMKTINGLLYFLLYDRYGAGNDAVWRSDGTAAGTFLLRDLGTEYFGMGYFMSAGSKVCFMTGRYSNSNSVLFSTDGTAAGTVPLYEFSSIYNNNLYPAFANIGSTLYFAAHDGVNGKELWKTDGTAGGTVLAADINTGSANSAPTGLVVLNNQLYFAATTAAAGNELWKFDGTTASLVKDINPGTAGSLPFGLVVSDNNIVFRANNGINGAELWSTDGTAANTVMIADINPGAGSSSANTFTPGNPVYFAASNGVNGFEVYKLDNNPDMLPGPHRFYVNDNSLTGDVFTLAAGSNSNNGSKTYPFATIAYAVTKVQAGDTIYVDAGTYVEQVTLDKGITIIGAGRDITSLLKPAVTTPPPGTFTEQGIIQTAQNIGDVQISDLSVTGDPAGVTPIILQTGGSVKNCKLQSGNQGIFFRVESTVKTAVVENNIINAEYIGVNFAGTGLTASLLNNTITVNNTGFSAGIFAGVDFGALPSFTATGNFISNYATWGFYMAASNSSITQNSIIGSGEFAILRIGGNTPNAGCNWYGSADVNTVVPKFSGVINYSPWLINGTDNDPVAAGFQPVPGTCTGRQNRFYVNDNSITGDVFTTAVGNDGNSGISSAPLATIGTAYSRAQAGDTIFVDAGTHVSGGTIAKAITILGTNYLISPNDGTNPLMPNAGRNAESIIINSTFTIGADNINFNGCTFDPGNRALFVQTNNALDFSNINLSKNRFLISSNQTQINITGRNSTPLTSSNYTFTDNRFDKTAGTAATTLILNYITNANITGNVFTTSNAAMARIQSAVGIGTLGKVDNLSIANNNFDRAATAISTSRYGTTVIDNNRCYDVNNGFTLTNSIAEPATVTVRNNLFTNVRTNGAVFFNRTNTNDNSSPNRFICEGNTINIDVTGQTATSSFVIASTVSASTVLTADIETSIKRNHVNYTGDFSTITGTFSLIGFRFAGRHTNILIDSNEVSLSGVNIPSLLSTQSTGTLIFSNPGTVNGTIPANAVININNNKISGFKQSVAFNNASGGTYGGLLNGITANINNNSFTGDSISINNGTVSQTINANCNWYGSAAAQNVVTKITPATVNYSPWLNSGTDNDPAIGFQPVPGSCNGTAVSVVLTQATNINCFGQNTGAINITVTGGVAPYTFAWTKTGDANYSAFTEDISSLTAGTYHLAFNDALGSTATLDVTLTEPAAALAISLNGINITCFGNNNGSITADVNGGTTPYTYQWSNGATSSAINGLAGGAYTVVVNDANGCNVSMGYNVIEPALLTVSLTGTSASCNGSVTATAAGGTIPYTYLWNNNATTQSISNVPAGTYSVTVTDAHGCTVAGTHTITGNSPINPTASVVNVSCFGTATGTITVTGAGGIAPRTYNINGAAWQANNVFSNLPAGTYIVGARDANGCSDFVTKTITQPALLTVVLDNTVRPCGSANNGKIFITAAGGTGGKSYSWTGPNGYTSNTQDPINLFAGVYNLVVTDTKGCTATLQVNLPELPQIIITTTVTNVSCRGTATGSIDATVTGGSGLGFTYQWTLPGGFFVNTEDLTGLNAGNYTLLVTDNDNGCTLSKTVVITQPAANLNLATAKTNVNGCISMGTITGTGSGGTAPYQYSLDGTNYQPSGIFVNVAGGTYTVYVKDANGCTNTKTVTVTDNGSDQYEGNNSKNQAKTINIGDNIAARIALATDVADWFRFTTGTAGNYVLTLTHPDANFIFNLYPAGNNAAALVPVNTTATTKEYVLAANTLYYAGITGGLSYTCYNLSVNAVSQPFTTPPVYTEKGKVPKDKVAEVKLTSVAYPNPHQGSFTLQINSPESGMAVIQLITAEGKLISATNKMLTKGNENTVSFTNIRDAVLFYRVTVGNQTITGKVLKQN